MPVKPTEWTASLGAFLMETEPMCRLLQERKERTRPSRKLENFYSLIKPLEKAAAQKGTSLTLTSYGKIEAKGQAGKHGFGFECPEGNPKHAPRDYILTTAKAGAKTTTSGNFFANLAMRDGWAGPCGTMWRLSHDPVRRRRVIPLPAIRAVLLLAI